MAENDKSSEPGTFFGRWSRRKREVLQAEASATAPPAAQPVEPPSQVMPTGVTSPADDASPSTIEQAPPSVEDAEQLTFDSDFSRFVSANTQPDVKNLALKKLFANPHFNQMDGLDIYIDDYGIADPLPDGWLEKMEHVKGWLTPKDEEPKPEAWPDERVTSAVPESLTDGTVRVEGGSTDVSANSDNMSGDVAK